MCWVCISGHLHIPVDNAKIGLHDCVISAPVPDTLPHVHSWKGRM